MEKKIIYSTAIIAILVVAIATGVTFAFFNYTKTGNANNIRTGRMNFNAEQGVEVTLSDLFPISATGTITPETPGVGSVTVHVTGDTNYEKGIEYRIKTVNVTGNNGTNLPISVNISYSNNGNGTTIGTETDDYYADRGGNGSVYQVLTTDTISENGELVMGYIAPGVTGIDGNIVIMAYLDADNIAITDTHPEEQTDTNNDGYIDGTDDIWVDNRTVFTTEEWNQLSSSGVSFQIKVEANEGLWIPGSFGGEATINKTSLVSGDIIVTSGNLKYIINASLETDYMTGNTNTVYSDASILRYNPITSNYDDITNSGEIDTVDITLQHNNCNGGESITITNHSEYDFKDGFDSVDQNDMQCLINNAVQP